METVNLIREKKKLLNDIVLKKMVMDKSKNALKNVNLEILPDKGERMKNVFIAHKYELKQFEAELARINEILSKTDQIPVEARSKPRTKQLADSSASSADSDKENETRRPSSYSPSAENSSSAQIAPSKAKSMARVNQLLDSFSGELDEESPSESSISDSSSLSSSSSGSRVASPKVKSKRRVKILDSSSSSVELVEESKTKRRSSSIETQTLKSQLRPPGLTPNEELDFKISSDSAEELSDESEASFISSAQLTSDKSSSDSIIQISEDDEKGRSSYGTKDQLSLMNDSVKSSSQSARSPPGFESDSSRKSSLHSASSSYRVEDIDRSTTLTKIFPPKNDIKSSKYAKPIVSSSQKTLPKNENKLSRSPNHNMPDMSALKISPETGTSGPANPTSNFSSQKFNMFAQKISPETGAGRPANPTSSFSSQKFSASPTDGPSTGSNGSVYSVFRTKEKDPESVAKPRKVIERPIWEAKLPSSHFNLNEMGKKALETHRVQASLTMDSLRTIHKSLESMPLETELTSDPKLLKSGVELMPHQKHALAWLLWRERQRPRGGILADDMGLGKTLTMISLILKNKELKEEQEEDGNSNSKSEEEDSDDETSRSRPKKYPGGTLVIAPASLLSQWEGEAKRRVKHDVLKVHVHHGSKREERAKRLARFDMVITTYGIVQSDAKDDDHSPLFGIAWERIIIDEAHQIRNPKTHSSIAVCRLTAKNRWALTGTPIHNKQLDMYGLLKFLRCKPFHDLSVWKRWVDNRDAAGTKRLNTVVKSIMLRRTKEQLLTKGTAKLPPKIFKKIEVELDTDEKEVYHKLLLLSSTLFAQYLGQRAEKAELNTYGISMSKKKNLDQLKNEEVFQNHPELAGLFKKMTQCQEIKAHQVLVFILRLRQMCCHPSLISAMIDKESISADGIEEEGLDIDFMDQFKRMSIKPGDVGKSEDDANDSPKLLSSSHPLFSKERISSKIRKVVEVLEKEILPTEDKVVIVSQWTGFLSILEAFLKEKNIRCNTLSGAIPIPERGPIVEKFNEPGGKPKILLLSLTAGGCGLNLVGGNHLMLIDIHWNPQLENQACDRIYRVGQKKDVFIYRFVTSDTIEEGIEKIQQKKLDVADQVLTGAKKIKASQLTLDDIKVLFGMDPQQPH